MQEVKKPELGIIPEQIWKEKRVDELTKAIERYCNVQKPIPEKWIEEYNKLTSELKTAHEKYMVWDNLFGILAWKFKPTESGDMFLDGKKAYNELSKKYLLIEL